MRKNLFIFYFRWKLIAKIRFSSYPIFNHSIHKREETQKKNTNVCMKYCGQIYSHKIVINQRVAFTPPTSYALHSVLSLFWVEVTIDQKHMNECQKNPIQLAHVFNVILCLFIESYYSARLMGKTYETK